MMELSFGPMEGITSYIYRNLHAEMFPGADKYYAPFIAPDSEGSFKSSMLKDILPENNRPPRLIPQILANNSSAFLSVARELAAMGYDEVDLNAGCPSGTVFSKHKGAGMLADPEALDRFLAEIFEDCPIRISVKTRMGVSSTAEFEKLFDIYSRYPLSELTVHARDRAGQYKSVTDKAAFSAAFLRRGNMKLCFNGDIFTAADAAALQEQFPGLDGCMIARGAIAAPAVFRVIKGGSEPTLDEIRCFHDRLVSDTLEAGICEHYTVIHMKELWSYLGSMFPGCEKQLKQLRKSRYLSDYKIAAEQIFRSCFFDPHAGFSGIK